MKIEANKGQAKSLVYIRRIWRGERSTLIGVNYPSFSTETGFNLHLLHINNNQNFI